MLCFICLLIFLTFRNTAALIIRYHKIHILEFCIPPVKTPEEMVVIRPNLQIDIIFFILKHSSVIKAGLMARNITKTGKPGNHRRGVHHSACAHTVSITVIYDRYISCTISLIVFLFCLLHCLCELCVFHLYLSVCLLCNGSEYPPVMKAIPAIQK